VSRMRIAATIRMVRAGNARARLRALRDGQGALRLSLVAAGLESGVFDALLSAPADLGGLAERIGARDAELLDAFLRVLQSAGHVRAEAGRWHIEPRTAQALADGTVRAIYRAFAGFHTGLYRDLSGQFIGGPGRRDVVEHGALIARLSQLFEPFVEHLLTRVVHERQPLRVLDIGCGAGHHLATMLAAAPSAVGVGIEADADAAELAAATLAGNGQNSRAQVITGDMRSLLGDGATAIGGAVDLALLANAIYYVPPEERAAFLSSIGSTLAPGGAVLIVTTAATPRLTSRHFDLLLRAQSPPMQLPTVEALVDAVAQAALSPRRPEQIAPGEPLFAVLATRSN
jgi:SAM-dependent methyltransferase